MEVGECDSEIVLESHFGQRIHGLVKCFQCRTPHRASAHSVVLSSRKLLKKDLLTNVQEQIRSPLLGSWRQSLFSLYPPPWLFGLGLFASQARPTLSLFKRSIPASQLQISIVLLGDMQG